MRDAPVSRSELRRALVLNALITPVNVLVPAGVLVAGAIFGAAWLALVALACWLVLAGVTFFDEREAQRVGERVRAARRGAVARVDPAEFSIEIGARVKAANAAREAIHAAIATSPSPLAGVAGEVDALLTAMNADAVRAQRIHGFLAAESLGALERRINGEGIDTPIRAALEAKLASLKRLRKRLGGLLSEMDNVVATLQTVQAEILAADDLEHAAQDGALAEQISDLRAKVEIMSAGLEESFAETRRKV